MKIFNKVFLRKHKLIKFDLLDNLFNFLGFLKMNYFYIRHKIYNHYYRFFESKIKYYNDWKWKKKQIKRVNGEVAQLVRAQDS